MIGLATEVISSDDGLARHRTAMTGKTNWRTC